MSDTTTTALDALLADYRHLEARGDDDVINEFRDGLVADVLAEREKLAAALRECVSAMEYALGIGILCACGETIPQLRAAADKARAALGE